MVKSKSTRMESGPSQAGQHLTSQGLPAGPVACQGIYGSSPSPTICGITQQGVAYVPRMDPDLVGTTCVQLPLHNSCTASPSLRQHPVVAGSDTT
eukprot:CAMPEP_0202381244 /NCGR_PEP_ID=MMETSP1127-20130417/34375_1 /ASSEMBLY_ACC=CAM_ASM_000462 /TAXON_ID=3047 /ORGANISM="Dunaliella tertiolecta, Strain CCMP1320" /LENGTH=94 /DNA_ID=CAMNT_0048980141 /DNA_START=220 /DNA_END=500 /DNA_ORIENTATION=+